MDWLSDLWRFGFSTSERTRGRAVKRYLRALEAYERELAALPAPEARAAAERVLAAPRFLRVTRWQDPPPPRPELAPALGEFFQVIQRVEVPGREECADISELQPVEWAPEYLYLGTDGEHTHLGVRAGDESIYVLTDDVPDEDRVESVFGSIYHWVLWLERKESLLAEFNQSTA